MTTALALYYLTGLMWFVMGTIPGPSPLGWLRHDMPLSLLAAYVVVMAAIWPLVLAKIIFDVANGIEETEL